MEKVSSVKIQPIYKLRDRLHQPKGEFGESDLLERIASGALTGEEEISVDPYIQWQKISSHPIFYDAFLKRLFSQAQSIEEKASYHAKPVESPRTFHTFDERATFHKDMSRVEKSPDDKGEAPASTRQLDKPVDIGGTIHQSEIDELFADTKGKADVDKELAAHPSHDNTHVLGDASDEPPAAIVPALETPTPPTEPSKHKEPTASHQKKNKKVVIAASVGAILFLLYFFGQNESAPLVQVDTEKKSDLDKAAQLEAIAHRKSYLLRVAATAYAGDTVPGYRFAVDHLLKAVALETPGVDVLANVVMAYAHSTVNGGLTQEEETSYKTLKEKLALLEPQHSALYRAEAIRALSEKKIEDAIRLSNDALEADPTDGENRLVHGEAMLKQGDVEVAQGSLKAAISARPDLVRGYYLLAQLYLDRGKFEDAKNMAAQAVALNPAHPGSYVVLGDILSQQGLLRETRVYYDIATRLFLFAPKSTAAYAALRAGRLLEIEGKTDEAKKYLTLAWNFDPVISAEIKDRNLSTDEKVVESIKSEIAHGVSHFESRAKEYSDQKRYADAAKFYTALRYLYPKDLNYTLKLAELVEKQAKSFEDYQQAAEMYREVIQQSPDQALAYLRIGILETDQYNLDRGLEFLNKAQSLDPESWEIQLALGKHFYKKQDFDAAGSHLRQAQFMNPNVSEIYYYQAMLYRMFNTESLQEPMRLFYHAYSLDTENYEALAEWLKTKVLTRDKLFSVKFIKNLVDGDPANADLYWIFGEVYAANSEFYRAISYFHKALDRNNVSSRFRMSLAKALLSIGKLGEAVAEFKKASEQDPKNGDGLFEAAGILLEAKEYARAEQVLRDLLKIYPNFPGARRKLAGIYRATKKQDLALAEMRKESENNPGNFRYTIELAEFYMNYKQYEPAIVELEKVSVLAIEEIVKQPSGGPEGGERQIRKETGNRGEKIRALLLLSQCYRALNRAETAEGAIQAAIALDKKEPELYRELGYVYSALHRDNEAKRAFESYLDRNPAAKDASEIRQIIKRTVIEE